MATLTELTTGAQTVTATGAVTATAGVDISTAAFLTADVTVCVEVLDMTKAKTARITLEDTITAFTTAVALWTWNVTGQMGEGTAFTASDFNPCTARNSVRRYQLPNNNFGVTSGKMRINVTAIDANTSLTLHAWIEQ